MELDQVGPSTFAEHLGSRFRVVDEPGVELELIEVTPHPSRAGPGRASPFSLVFLGPRDRPLPQKIHALEHDRLGSFGLFLVPVGPGLRYEAVFN